MLMAAEHVEGWEVELQCYLNDMLADVTPETDIVKYLEVCNPFPILNLTQINSLEPSRSVPDIWMDGS